MADIDLEAMFSGWRSLLAETLLGAARAAKLEIGSGEWLVGPSFARHSDGRTWAAHDVGAPGHDVVAESCRPAAAAYIAAADPDTVIALVERLQAAEARVVELKADRDAAIRRADAAERRWEDACEELGGVLRGSGTMLGEARQAHADAQAMLEEIAAERDHLAEDRAWNEAINAGLLADERTVAARQSTAILELIDVLRGVRDELRRLAAAPAVDVDALRALAERANEAISGEPGPGWRERVLAAIGCTEQPTPPAEDRYIEDAGPSWWSTLRPVQERATGGDRAVVQGGGPPASTIARPPLEPDCPGPDCPMCNGAMCNLCGAGCWNNAAPHCEHAGDERHRAPRVALPSVASEADRAIAEHMAATAPPSSARKLTRPPLDPAHVEVLRRMRDEEALLLSCAEQRIVGSTDEGEIAEWREYAEGQRAEIAALEAVLGEEARS